VRLYQPLIAGAMTLTAWVCPAAVGAQRVTGAGQQATALFKLPVGLAVFELEHSGDGPFVVRLLDDRGALIDTLARATGPFRGSKAVHVPHRGAYLYDVLAGGAWTIALRPSPVASVDVHVAAMPPSVAPAVVSSPPGITTNPIALQATVDAEQAARQKGVSPWMLRGLAGGTVLGPVGAALVYMAANKKERAPLSDIEARRTAHGNAYADAFSEAYQARRRSDRRVAALVGGATGTVVFGFIVAQIINWSKESGGRGGPGDGELP
jgi:hypothetical protein